LWGKDGNQNLSMAKRILVGLVLILGLCGCYSSPMTKRTVTSRVVKDKRSTTIYLNKDSKIDYMRIDKVINSSCLCADAIAEKYVNGRIVYRLYYGCSIYRTRKEEFSYCSRGAVIGPRLFDGTEMKGTDFETRLNATDKFVLHKIDSFIQTEGESLGRFKLCKKDIEGFKVIEYDIE
jgi:hypothetical protein